MLILGDAENAGVENVGGDSSDYGKWFVW